MTVVSAESSGPPHASDQRFRCEHCGLRFAYALWHERVGATCPNCLRATRSFLLAMGTRRQRRLYRIGDRDGWVCHLCGCRVRPKGRGYLAPTIDHLVPRSLGGGGYDTNLRLAHRYCNSRRGNTPVPVRKIKLRWWAEPPAATTFASDSVALPKEMFGPHNRDRGARRRPEHVSPTDPGSN
jgi:5-methylcytosine-specific restriction endonuclease McrA